MSRAQSNDDLISSGPPEGRGWRWGQWRGGHRRAIQLTIILTTVALLIAGLVITWTPRFSPERPGAKVVAQGSAALTGSTCQSHVDGDAVIGVQFENSSASSIRLYEADGFVTGTDARQVATSWDQCVIGSGAASTVVSPGSPQWVSFRFSGDAVCGAATTLTVSLDYVIDGRGGGTFNLLAPISCTG